VLRNCPICGRLLITPQGAPCVRCQQDEDAAVDRITAYLHDGGVATMAQVAQNTGVRAALLRRLTASGRVLLEDSNGRIPTCSVCGQALRLGGARVCPACAAMMRGGPAQAASSPAAAERPSVRRGGFYSRRDREER